MQFICDYTVWLCLSVFEISTVHLKKRVHTRSYIPTSASRASAMEILLSFGCCGADSRWLAKSILLFRRSASGFKNEGQICSSGNTEQAK